MSLNSLSHPKPRVTSDAFPFGVIIASALCPALLGLACAVFISPPLFFSDTAVGFMTWLNFIDGGTWNTILTLDQTNIAQSAEMPISWWAPGQYVPAGTLHSLGLSIGTASLIVAFIGTLLFGLGLALLAHEMGMPRRGLIWLTVATCSTQYMFLAFGVFMGGEVAQSAVWPWAAFVALRLRERPISLICLLPFILILGAFAKHSFAIYALAILVFLWIEALRNLRGNTGMALSWKPLWLSSYPIFVVGVLFAVGRHFLIDTSFTPGTQGLEHRSFYQSLGYSVYGPLLALSGIDKSVAYFSHHLAGVTPEDLWSKLGPMLTLLSILPLGLYFWLSCRRLPIDRIAGIVSLVAGGVFFILLWGGGAISFDSRHYQPASMLLLMSVAARVATPNRLLSLASSTILIGVILFGCCTLLQRHIKMRSPRLGLYRDNTEHLTHGTPQSVISELRKIAKEKHSVIILISANQGCVLNSSRDPTTRFLLIDDEKEYEEKAVRYGRVPRLALAMRNKGIDLERAPLLRESFKDYSPEEWVSHELDGWVIWQAGDIIPLGEEEAERS